MLLAWLLVRDALRPTDELLPGTIVLLSDGAAMDAAQWQRQLRRRRLRGAAGQGPGRAAGDQRGRGGRRVRGGRPGAAPTAPGHGDRPAARRGDPGPADRLLGRRRRGGRAGQDVRRHAGPDRVRLRGAEALRGQRLARAAYPARRDAHGDRRDAQRRRRGRRRVPPDGDSGPRRLGAGQRPGGRAAGAGPQRGAGRAAAGPAYRVDLAAGHRQRAVGDAPRGGTDRPAGARRHWSPRRSSATRGCSTGWPAT